MKTYREEAEASQTQMPLSDFLVYYNKNLPAHLPRVTTELLLKFKREHKNFFKHEDLWSPDEHRKKILDWFQINGHTAQ